MSWTLFLKSALALRGANMSKAEKLKVLIAICMAIISLYIITYAYNIPLTSNEADEPLEISVPVVSIANEINSNIAEESKQD